MGSTRSGIAAQRKRELSSARDAAASAYRQHVKVCLACGHARGRLGLMCGEGWSLIRGVTAAVNALREHTRVTETGQDGLW